MTLRSPWLAGFLALLLAPLAVLADSDRPRTVSVSGYGEVAAEPEVSPDTAVRPVAESSGSQSAEAKGTVAATADNEPAPVTAVPQAASEVPLNPPVKEREASPASSADDIFFMVQIAAMPRDREMDKNQLKNIETVTKIEEGDRVKYAAGKFPVYDDAIKYRRTLVLGFPDAFVIAVRNGKTMPLAEAINAKKQK